MAPAGKDIACDHGIDHGAEQRKAGTATRPATVRGRIQAIAAQEAPA